MQDNNCHKIGVLIPQSNAYPLMGKDFMNGLRLGLTDLNFELIVEGIGLGADPKQLINAAQKFIYQDEVAITTGLFGHYGFADLAKFFSNNDEVLLAAQLGSNATESLPKNVYLNSLGLYDSLRDLVHYLSKSNPTKIASSTCYYDSGYGFIDSLAKEIEQTENVVFSGHYITPHIPREDESSIMNEVITGANPDAIIAFHNSVFAEEHASYLAKNNLQNKYPIYALPFSGGEDLIEKYPAIFQKITLLSSWFLELKSEANAQFIDDYKAKHGRNPSFFALLGYENGLVIKNVLQAKRIPLSSSLNEIAAAGPRGILAFDPIKRKTAFPNYLWEINNHGKTIIAKLENRPAKAINEPSEEIVQGWFNAYLCH